MLYATNYNAQYHTDKQRRSLLANTPCLVTLFYRHAPPYLPDSMNRHAPPYLQNSLQRHGPPIPVLLSLSYFVMREPVSLNTSMLKVIHCPPNVLYSRATVHNDLLKIVHCPPNVLHSRATMTYAGITV